jgi:hypothetical protein
MAALSPAEPTWPIDPTSWWRHSSCWSFRARNCDPRSECSVHPATFWPSTARRATALLSASTAILDSIRSLME